MHFLTMIIWTEQIIAEPLHVYNCLWQVKFMGLTNCVESVCWGGGGGEGGQSFILHHSGGLNVKNWNRWGGGELINNDRS